MQAKHYLGAKPTDRHSRNAEVVLWLAIFGAAITATTLFAALLAFCSPAAPPPIHAGGQNTGFAPNTHPKEKMGFGAGRLAATAPANVSAGVTDRRDGHFARCSRTETVQPETEWLLVIASPGSGARVVSIAQGLPPVPSRPSSWGAAPSILGEMAADAKGLSFAHFPPVDHVRDRDRLLFEAIGALAFGQTGDGSEPAGSAQGEV